MEAIRATVRGRVQGVGFRYYVSGLAETLGAQGEVWNRRDGAVEILVGHDDCSVLNDFVQRLSAGPGRVDAVETESWEGEVAPGFRIGSTR